MQAWLLHQFNTSAILIRAYTGTTPLQHYLKQYFAQNKKHGSKDRKSISHFCYSYYRLGHSLHQTTVEDSIKAGLFLCSESLHQWHDLFTSEWIEAWQTDLQKRIQFVQSVYPCFNPARVFPWHPQLSESIDLSHFSHSHFSQPDLFIRARPGKKVTVQNKLKANSIPYKEIGKHCFAISNNTKIDAVIQINRDAVIQDFSSQRIAEFLQRIPEQQKPFSVWDCCAASGGKSILAVDILPNIQLTVSDIRPAILHNLQKRFAEAGIRQYRAVVSDLSANKAAFHNSFQLVICDVPCSGSGTWGRTPEQLCFFEESQIKTYHQLQQKIVSNAIAGLQDKGYFLYITCSVFAAENENMVHFIMEKFGLQLLHAELLKGWENKADSMFAALLQK